MATARKCRHVGSGLWFIHSQVFQEFKTGSRKHLWLHGLAGSVKTVLSSRIFEYFNDTSGIPTLAYYFDFNDAEKQHLDGLIRSLAFQLCQSGGEVALAKLYELFMTHDKGSKSPDELQLETYIKSILRTFDRAFILIDALDECKSRDSLLPWIGQFAVENVQFLLTARPEDDIQSQTLRLFGKENYISLDNTSVNSDIKSYVRSVLDTNPGFMEKALSEELRNDICTKVGEGADGMFRWAACQMDTLEACLTPNAVREALVSLPRDLPKTYDRMMESIPPQYKNVSIRLLRFAVNCERPLSLAEAVEILATRPDQYHDRLRFDPENRLFNFSHIERYCPGMIHIVTDTDEGLDEMGDMCRGKEVHLTHFSVKEYLTKLDAFCELDTAIVITETLISYLYDVKDPLYRVRADFPLAIRAENIWCEFARRAQTVKKIVQMTARLLFSRSSVLKLYRISQQPSDDWYCSSGPRGKRLYRRIGFYGKVEDGFSKACLGGLHSTVAYMMEDPKFNVPAKDKEACLMWAIDNKHPEVAEVFLDYGVSPDVLDDGRSAIHEASKAGFTALVRKLIKAGADLSGDTLEGRSYFVSALCVASQNGHLAIVEDLLKAGNHARMQDSLLRAVENGQTAIVELLTSWGACEAEPINDHVLETAAFRGTIQLVRRLLDSAPDGYDISKVNNALLKACEAGRVNIIRLLVSRGAQADRPIDFKYKYYENDYLKLDWSEDNCKIHRNCLVVAAHSGNEDVIQILLNNEFDLSQVLDLKKELKVTTSIYVGKAFVRALLGCHQRVITTLLNAMVNHAHTAEIATLRAASKDHNQHVLRVFSEAVSHDMGGMFPDFPWVVEKLHNRLLWQHRHIPQILLKEAGKHYSMQSECLKELLRPLEVAASVGSVSAITKFIQAGVDLSFGDRFHDALVKRHEQAVRLL
ncbi:hypothetical protein FVEG_15925 [Fusarium verticillioides 7600]|uniref:Nephrocystin 3-like N-terminal domain-containing protein n=1 Tax=Gibberella moniliformis (strain M3125 / FGSC 7600) TaxID=334819 RepID=W7M535_GIBM7|nr:hypothetical protein FVEG_15925 [Fusarium verticillioides 7600]EWG46121.1 hypothetical protein FVEG_15925 [Fusarium verticillioides 7600]